MPFILSNRIYLWITFNLYWLVLKQSPFFLSPGLALQDTPINQWVITPRSLWPESINVNFNEVSTSIQRRLRNQTIQLQIYQILIMKISKIFWRPTFFFPGVRKVISSWLWLNSSLGDYFSQFEREKGMHTWWYLSPHFNFFLFITIFCEKIHVDSINQSLVLSVKAGESQPAQEPGAGLMVIPSVHSLAFHAVFLRWSCSFSASWLVTVASWWFGQDVAWERVVAGGTLGEASQSVLCSAQTQTPSPGWCSLSPNLLDSLVCKQRNQKCLQKAVVAAKASQGWICSSSYPFQHPGKMKKRHPWRSALLGLGWRLPDTQNGNAAFPVVGCFCSHENQQTSHTNIKCSQPL